MEAKSIPRSSVVLGGGTHLGRRWWPFGALAGECFEMCQVLRTKVLQFLCVSHTETTNQFSVLCDILLKPYILIVPPFGC